ncbi:MAG: 3'(2'),5'-bisphosphate nucleotidase CysQ [Thermomicrobiales bacterium]
MSNYEHELALATEIARSAGAAILGFYEAHSATEYEKSDGSPVTDADLAADTLIRAALQQHFPNDALMTEEGADDLVRLDSSRCWIVDPLDGTAQFINRSGEFDVMIALIEDQEPVVAVIYQPTTGLLYAATRGGGAWRQTLGEPEPVRMVSSAAVPVLASSTYYGGREIPDVFACIAGAIEATPPMLLSIGFQPRRVVQPTWMFDAFIGLWPPDGTRFAREWDLAAPQLFTEEAGGAFTDAYGQRYRYNQPETLINRGLIAANDPNLHARLIAAIEKEFIEQTNTEA